MSYIVPKEMPKSCHDCPFHYCSEYHPFWSADKEKRNTQTIRCQAITPFRCTVLDIEDKTFKAAWCPLVEAADVRKMQSQINRLKKYDEERDIALHARLISCAKAECAKEIIEEIKNNSSTIVAVENGHEIYETKTHQISAIKLDEIKKKYGGMNADGL